MDTYGQPPAQYGQPPAQYGQPQPFQQPMAQPIVPTANPMPPSAGAPMDSPAPAFSSGGGTGMSEPIPKDAWIGFMFAFLSGAGIGYIWTQRQQNKFPKLI